MPDRQVDHNGFSLSYYLSQSYLAPLKIEHFTERCVAPRWEVEGTKGLHMMERSRPLRVVRRVRPEASVRQYFRALDHSLITIFRYDNEDIEKGLADMQLPAEDLAYLPSSAKNRLIAWSETMVANAIEKSILPTVLTALHCIDACITPGLGFERLDFEEYLGETIWPVYGLVEPAAKHRPGAIVRGASGAVSMVVLCIPPWEFGSRDFGDFVIPRNFRRGVLDKPEKPGKLWNNCDSAWVMLYEACLLTGARHFAITTYKQWAFGTFSDSLQAAEVTSVMHHRWRTDNMTVAEIFTVWAQCARGSRWFSLAEEPSPEECVDVERWPCRLRRTLSESSTDSSGSDLI
ncbi:hypothetical protein CERSUDRAFT_95593 [Gelatoporia subvermispora B]|uniref:Uncharacterized protein n=1 Tax=Ceriporiopsis subvermispora (strain B) TaxID=914234 RepID=M2PJ66_CERS8|nr:hypothetical protein CERSUDRAFT_95593 [Gelatoporia subvermispora B]